jgi:hypothetical protein
VHSRSRPSAARGPAFSRGLPPGCSRRAPQPPPRRTFVEAGEGANILQISTLETHLSHALVLDRLTTTLVGLCGLIALAMSTIGVYGVMIDAVQRRTREIGLSLALGAGRMQITRLVFMEAV